MQRVSIAVIDDDESVRDSLPDLLKVFGFDSRVFGSAEEFLDSDALATSGCLILDIGLPGMSGPDLQLELARRQLNIPIIFVTAQSDKSVRSKLLARGAVECLFKPFSGAELQAALASALGGT